MVLNRQSRPDGFNGPRPIPLAELGAYLATHGVADPIERSNYEDAISILDEAFLAHQFRLIAEREAAEERTRKRTRARARAQRK